MTTTRHPRRRPLRRAAAVAALAALAVAGASPGAAESAEWTKVAPLSGPRSGHTAATGGDGRVYAIGGQEGLTVLRTVEAYDPGRGRWKAAPPLHRARAFAASATAPDGTVYVFGGYGPSSGAFVVRRSVEAYTPGASSWVRKPPMPTPRFGAAAVTGPDGRIYVVGGATDGATDSGAVEVFDPVRSRWESLPPLLLARSYLGAAVSRDGEIVAIGGVLVSDDFVPSLADVEVYSVAANSWRIAAPLSFARHGAAAVAAFGRIYVVGGAWGCIEGCVLRDSVEVFTPRERWTAGPPLPQPRSWHAAALGGDRRIYVIGGTVANERGALRQTAGVLALSDER